jgi:DNA-binding NarL/FixJ family response regulator
VVRGLSNRDIAELLKIREDSVKKHTNAIYAKIGASNRVEATAIAIRKQLLD